MVILSSLLTQYFALGFFHTPFEFLFRCSFGRSQYKATSRRALLLSLVFSGISRHVFRIASETFFSLCITSMLWRSSNFRKYSSCHKPLIAINCAPSQTPQIYSCQFHHGQDFGVLHTPVLRTRALVEDLKLFFSCENISHSYEMHGQWEGISYGSQTSMAFSHSSMRMSLCQIHI